MLLDDQGLKAWFVILFFGLVTGTALFTLFSKSNYLLLDQNGFEQKMMGRSAKFRWANVAEFGVIRIAGNTFITFQQRSPNVSQQLADNFGMQPLMLIELMEQYREYSRSTS